MAGAVSHIDTRRWPAKFRRWYFSQHPHLDPGRPSRREAPRSAREALVESDPSRLARALEAGERLHHARRYGSKADVLLAQAEQRQAVRRLQRT